MCPSPEQAGHEKKNIYLVYFCGEMIPFNFTRGGYRLGEASALDTERLAPHAYTAQGMPERRQCCPPKRHLVS